MTGEKAHQQQHHHHRPHSGPERTNRNTIPQRRATRTWKWTCGQRGRQPTGQVCEHRSQLTCRARRSRQAGAFLELLHVQTSRAEVLDQSALGPLTLAAADTQFRPVVHLSQRTAAREPASVEVGLSSLDTDAAAHNPPAPNESYQA